ncbi:MAG: hypothetical protein O9353_05455 [Bacteroidia bacterium]|nr:hypothetical protein [Bacteroidia bacterium]
MVFLFIRMVNGFSQDTTGLILYPTFISSYRPAQPLQIKDNKPYLIGGTIISYKNIYAELRYNYEQYNTLGIYGGRSFVISKPKMQHVLTPQLGIMVGNYKGGSFQFYYLGYHKAFDISFLNQYSIPVSGQSQFYYNWSGIDFTVYKAFRLGVSGQYYSDVQTNFNTLDAGIYAAIKTNNTTIQLYWFNGYDIDGQSLSLFLQQKISFKKKKRK